MTAHAGNDAFGLGAHFTDRREVIEHLLDSLEKLRLGLLARVANAVHARHGWTVRRPETLILPAHELVLRDFLCHGRKV